MVEISDGTEGNNLLDYVEVSPKKLSSYPSKDVEIFSLKNILIYFLVLRRRHQFIKQLQYLIFYFLKKLFVDK